MTPDHDPERKSERAELVLLADVLESRGRNNSLHDIQRAASALRSLAAQDQKPCGWQWSFGGSWHTVDTRDVPDPEKYALSISRVVRPIYTATPPAAGWDGLARAYLIGRGYDACRIDDLKDANAAEWQVALQITKALRHNAPPDSGAGKSDDTNAGLRQLTAIEQDCINKALLDSGTVVGSLPPRGGADAGMREALYKLIEYVERNECTHEETHRGGGIWTICNECGRKWADDQGGFIPYKEPPELTKAKAALSHQPAPVAANASAEQWATELPDGSVSFDAYAGWSRDQLKDRCLELIRRIEQLEEASNASAEARLREAEAILRYMVKADENNTWACNRYYLAGRAKAALSQHPHASDCTKSDGAIYSEVSKRETPPEERAALDAFIDEALKDPAVCEALERRPHASDCDKQGDQ